MFDRYEMKTAIDALNNNASADAPEFDGIDHMEDVFVGYLADGELCPACHKPALITNAGICRQCEIEIFEDHEDYDMMPAFMSTEANHHDMGPCDGCTDNCNHCTIGEGDVADILSSFILNK